MRALGDMLNPPGQDLAGDQSQGAQPGQGQPSDTRGADGQPRDGRPIVDPLGRQHSGNGNVITSDDPLAEGEDPAARARDLLDEIRRRSGERDRPPEERDYLGRLLERF